MVFAYDITGTESDDWKPTRSTADEIIATAHAANPIDSADAALKDLDVVIDRARVALAALKDGPRSS